MAAYDLMSIISKRRNKLISDILVKCNVMEAAGTGFEKIVREYKDAVIRIDRLYIPNQTTLLLFYRT